MSGSPLGNTGIVARDAVLRLCAEDRPPLELLAEVSRRVGRAVPHAGAGWMTTDPATHLHTGAVHEGVPLEVRLGLIENEIAREDVAKFSDVARMRRPAVALSEATGGRLERSPRHREVYAPAGFGDELRGAFRRRTPAGA